jgi:hypothetical protein
MFGFQVVSLFPISLVLEVCLYDEGDFHRQVVGWIPERYALLRMILDHLLLEENDEEISFLFLS